MKSSGSGGGGSSSTLDKYSLAIANINKLTIQSNTKFDQAQFVDCLDLFNKIGTELRTLCNKIQNDKTLNSSLRTLYLTQIADFSKAVSRTANVVQHQVDTLNLPSRLFSEAMIRTFTPDYSYYREIIDATEGHSTRDQISLSSALEKFDVSSPTEVSVIGNEKAIGQIDALVQSSKIPENLQRVSKNAPYIILAGPPGTGKTMLARYTAYKVAKKLAVLRLSDIQSSYQGETEKNLSDLLRALPKLWVEHVVLFDEADTFFSARSDSNDGIDNRMVSMSLPIFDIIANETLPTNSYLFFTTNQTLDEALRRRCVELVIEKPKTYDSYVKLFNMYCNKYCVTLLDVRNFVSENIQMDNDDRLSPAEIELLVRDATKFDAKKIRHEYVINLCDETLSFDNNRRILSSKYVPLPVKNKLFNALKSGDDELIRDLIKMTSYVIRSCKELKFYFVVVEYGIIKAKTMFPESSERDLGWRRFVSLYLDVFIKENGNPDRLVNYFTRRYQYALRKNLYHLLDNNLFMRSSSSSQCNNDVDDPDKDAAELEAGIFMHVLCTSTQQMKQCFVTALHQYVKIISLGTGFVDDATGFRNIDEESTRILNEHKELFCHQSSDYEIHRSLSSDDDDKEDTTTTTTTTTKLQPTMSQLYSKDLVLIDEAGEEIDEEMISRDGHSNLEATKSAVTNELFPKDEKDEDSETDMSEEEKEREETETGNDLAPQDSYANLFNSSSHHYSRIKNEEREETDTTNEQWEERETTNEQHLPEDEEEEEKETETTNDQWEEREATNGQHLLEDEEEETETTNQEHLPEEEERKETERSKNLAPEDSYECLTNLFNSSRIKNEKSEETETDNEQHLKETERSKNLAPEDSYECLTNLFNSSRIKNEKSEETETDNEQHLPETGKDVAASKESYEFLTNLFNSSRIKNEESEEKETGKDLVPQDSYANSFNSSSYHYSRIKNEEREATSGQHLPEEEDREETETTNEQWEEREATSGQHLPEEEDREETETTNDQWEEREATSGQHLPEEEDREETETTNEQWEEREATSGQHLPEEEDREETETTNEQWEEREATSGQHLPEEEDREETETTNDQWEEREATSGQHLPEEEDREETETTNEQWEEREATNGQHLQEDEEEETETTNQEHLPEEEERKDTERSKNLAPEDSYECLTNLFNSSRIKNEKSEETETDNEQHLPETGKDVAASKESYEFLTNLFNSSRIKNEESEEKETGKDLVPQDSYECLTNLFNTSHYPSIEKEETEPVKDLVSRDSLKFLTNLFNSSYYPKIETTSTQSGGEHNTITKGASPKCFHKLYDNTTTYDMVAFACLYMEDELDDANLNNPQALLLYDDEKKFLSYGHVSNTANILQMTNILDDVLLTMNDVQLELSDILYPQSQTDYVAFKCSEYFNAMNTYRFLLLFFHQAPKGCKWSFRPIDEAMHGFTLNRLWELVMVLAFRENTLVCRYAVESFNLRTHMFQSMSLYDLQNLFVFRSVIVFGSETECNTTFNVLIENLVRFSEAEYRVARREQRHNSVYPEKHIWLNVYDILEWKINAVGLSGSSGLVEFHRYTENYKYVGITDFYFNKLYPSAPSVDDNINISYKDRIVLLDHHAGFM
ncbi:hypothetical protein WDU94_012441 [Cyamophila willieti]